MIQRQDLHCTNCGRHVVFDMDFDLDGNHEITCPECFHVHYRVVENGLITEERWQSSMQTYQAINVTTYTSGTSNYLYTAANTASATTDMGLAYYTYDSWLQTTT